MGLLLCGVLLNHPVNDVIKGVFTHIFVHRMSYSKPDHPKLDFLLQLLPCGNQLSGHFINGCVTRSHDHDPGKGFSVGVFQRGEQNLEHDPDNGAGLAGARGTLQETHVGGEGVRHGRPPDADNTPLLNRIQLLYLRKILDGGVEVHGTLTNFEVLVLGRDEGCAERTLGQTEESLKLPQLWFHSGDGLYPDGFVHRDVLVSHYDALSLALYRESDHIATFGSGVFPAFP